MQTSGLLNSWRSIAVALSILTSSQPALRAEFQITEFLADNSGVTFTDEDGFPADWIEIHNDSRSPASLLGYYLTDDEDDLTKWTFPDELVAASDHIVVFASSKDRAVAGSPLHTNFALRAGGEYLALVAPDGTTVLSEFTPEYPDQVLDISYGFGTAVDPVDFFLFGAEVKYFVPDAEIGDTWKDPGFDDSGWTTAHTPIGWGYSMASGDLFDIAPDGNLVADMRSQNSSIYVRIPFQLADPSAAFSLGLRMKVDDGFVAFINGTKVAEFNAPATLEYNSTSVGREEVNDDEDYDFFPLDFGNALVAGENILSIHGLNDSSGSSDFVLIPELIGEVRDLSVPPVAGYFNQPTPGSGNAVVRSTPPEEVEFSVSSRAFTEDFDLELSVPDAGAVIRYTIDGSVPTADPAGASPIYSAPLSIDGSTLVRARAYLPGAIDGPGRTEGYFKMGADRADFSSDLPVVMLSTFGGGVPPNPGSAVRKDVFMLIYEPDPETGRTTLAGEPSIATRGGFRKRGSSSLGFAKYAMSLESWDEFDEDKDIEPLGFSPEGDWILNSRYTFDMALIRNPFIYELSNQVGRYAVDTQFVELFNDLNGGDVSGNDYFGVYTFMEKIEPDDGRVEISDLDPWENTVEEITGGYVFKNDRGDSIDSIGVSGFSRMHLSDPEGDVITPEQKSYIVGNTNELTAALRAANGVNPTTGLHYSEYMDVESFIDHFWLNILVMDPDWGRLSQYFHKDRGGKIIAGPIWDYDRTMGSRDGRDDDPRRWEANTNDTSFTWFDNEYEWFGLLFGFSSSDNAVRNMADPQLRTDRPDVFQNVIDTWYALRGEEFSKANIDAIIDSMAAEIEEAQARNFVRWTGRNPGSIQGQNFSEPGTSGWEREISHLKGWLQARSEWIDEQFFAPPVFSQDGGVVATGFQLTISSPDGDVYYTLDGTDPRAPGGGIAPGAVLVAGPVTLNSTATVTARAYTFHSAALGEEWGAPSVARFTVGAELASASNLVISELMYNPVGPSPEEMTAGFTDGDQFEYVELLNISANPIDIYGVVFSEGVGFDFADAAIEELAPGARALIVSDQAAFVQRYGAGFNGIIAGEFADGTSLSNGGEQLALGGAAGLIRDFEYDDRHPWSESADGDGPSLVLISPTGNPDHAVATNWRASVGAMGSVGAGDSVAFSGDPDADADSDGLNAFAEYAFGTDDTVGDGQVLQGRMKSDGTLEISFPRNLAADDAVITVEISTDLDDWMPPSEDDGGNEIHNGDGTATIEIDYPSSLSDGERLFVRLRVSNR